MPAKVLTGPSLGPASGGRPRQLVVLLHGVGANGQDLISLAPFFADILPEAEFVAPDAPFHYDMAPFGHQWFSLMDRSAHAVAAGVRIAAPVLDAYLDTELLRRGLGDESMALVGFSQGAMMALHVAFRRPRACAGVLSYAGALVTADSLPSEIRARPPVMMVHGDADEVVPVEYMPLSATALQAVGVPVETHEIADLGHGIDERGIVLGRSFLARRLTAPLSD